MKSPSHPEPRYQKHKNSIWQRHMQKGHLFDGAPIYEKPEMPKPSQTFPELRTRLSLHAAFQFWQYKTGMNAYRLTENRAGHYEIILFAAVTPCN